MRHIIRCVIIAALFLSSAQLAVGQEGYREAYLQDAMRAAEKIVGLAQAIPESSYDWRPAEGVRSVAEALMHVAGGNYGIIYRTGAEISEEVPEAWYRDPDSVTDKDTVVQALNASFAFWWNAMESITQEDLAMQAPQAREGTTNLSVLMLAQTHLHEHLGQMIAYARSNGVVPPWSR